MDINVTLKPGSKQVIATWMPGSRAEDYILGADITARKPGGNNLMPVAPEPPLAESSGCGGNAAVDC